VFGITPWQHGFRRLSINEYQTNPFAPFATACQPMFTIICIEGASNFSTSIFQWVHSPSAAPSGSRLREIGVLFQFCF